MATWRIMDTGDGLRLEPLRSLNSTPTTWASLLSNWLSTVQVYVLYFPSRFNQPVDFTVHAQLRAFGRNTPSSTLANYWDTTDPNFSAMLAYFDLKVPPALVLMHGGEKTPHLGERGEDRGLYSIAVTDRKTLDDAGRLADAINSAHEVLMRGDAHQISRYLQDRQVAQLTALLRSIGESLADAAVKLKLRFQLPGGIGIQLGG